MVLLKKCKHLLKFCLPDSPVLEWEPAIILPCPLLWISLLTYLKGGTHSQLSALLCLCKCGWIKALGYSTFKMHTVWLQAGTWTLKHKLTSNCKLLHLFEVVSVISSEPFDFHGSLAHMWVNAPPHVLSDPHCAFLRQSLLFLPEGLWLISRAKGPIACGVQPSVFSLQMDHTCCTWSFIHITTAGWGRIREKVRILASKW